MNISFCRKCSFPELIKVDENIQIRKYNPNYYGEGNDIELDEKICPHIKQKASEILDICSRVNDIEDLGIDYIFDNWYIECLKCKDPEIKHTEYWLSNIILYLKGLANTK